MKNNFLLEMQSRGYLNQCTDLDKLSEICNKNQYLDILVSIALQAAYMLEVCCR